MIDRNEMKTNPEKFGFVWIDADIGTDNKTGNEAKYLGYRPDFVALNRLDLIREAFGDNWCLNALTTVGPGHAVTNAQRAAIKTGRVRGTDREALLDIAVNALAGIRASGTRTVVKYTTPGGTTVTSETEYLSVGLSEAIDTALEMGLGENASAFAKVQVGKAFEKIFGKKPTW